MVATGGSRKVRLIRDPPMHDIVCHISVRPKSLALMCICDVRHALSGTLDAPLQRQGVLSKQYLHADFDSKGISQRIVDRVPSIGRGQILTSEDAPARIDAGIELDLGLGGSEKRRSWPEEPDPVHNKAGVHRSQPGDGSRAPGELCSASLLQANCIHPLYSRSSWISAWGAPRRGVPRPRR